MTDYTITKSMLSREEAIDLFWDEHGEQPDGSVAVVLTKSIKYRGRPAITVVTYYVAWQAQGRKKKTPTAPTPEDILALLQPFDRYLRLPTASELKLPRDEVITVEPRIRL